MDNTNEMPVEEVAEKEAVQVVAHPSKTGESAVMQQLQLEEIIKNYIENLEKIRSELKAQREMFDDAFNNDSVYRDQTEKVKEATRARLATRQQILKQPSVAALGEKIKDLRFDIKDQEEALSDYLQQYQRMSGASEIEDGQGGLRQIINIAKLIKK